MTHFPLLCSFLSLFFSSYHYIVYLWYIFEYIGALANQNSKKGANKRSLLMFFHMKIL
ncbi:hypothetical protein B4417_3140 [Bacillus subtilis]|nr:hypothetical protein ABU16_0162 [Bacillus subtilis]EME08667.1 hypothetical protein BS732_0250 [Bacillus subtilis MB73/2]KZD78351.1 hypothetical protein B4417_3140 [Bacillus subtilis]